MPAFFQQATEFFEGRIRICLYQGREARVVGTKNTGRVASAMRLGGTTPCPVKTDDQLPDKTRTHVEALSQLPYGAFVVVLGRKNFRPQIAGIGFHRLYALLNSGAYDRGTRCSPQRSIVLKITSGII
jgi:hypothetical protein